MNTERQLEKDFDELLGWYREDQKTIIALKKQNARLQADNIDLSEQYAKTTRLLQEANKRIAELEDYCETAFYKGLELGIELGRGLPRELNNEG